MQILKETCHVFAIDEYYAFKCKKNNYLIILSNHHFKSRLEIFRTELWFALVTKRLRKM